jgi:hypothetical protein
MALGGGPKGGLKLANAAGPCAILHRGDATLDRSIKIEVMAQFRF